MSRLPPRDELVNTFEFEEAAKLRLPAAVYATIAGGDRSAFDRITFRPRMNIPTLDLDLSVELFGEKLFTPIIAGPISDQARYHSDAELATVRGASAAKAAVVISNRSSMPIDRIAEAAKTPLWYAVYAESGAQKQAQQALAAGCRAVCITIGVPNPRTDWKMIDRIRQDLKAPVIIKGVMTADDAKAAIDHGAQGIVVSDHGGQAAAKAAPIAVLSSIADAASGKAVVLIDGSFRRGTDILMAMVLGAQGVLIGRPVVWGLASYGAEGVQTVIEMLQTDLARNMAMLGTVNFKSLNRNMIRIHAR